MRPDAPGRGAPPGRGPRESGPGGRRAGGGGTRLPPGGGGIVRPPAGTVRGPLDGAVPGGGTGVPGVVGGRVAGGRLVMALPGRDDTTRGAGDTGGVAAAGGAVSGVVGGVTTLVTTVAGGKVDAGVDCVVDCAVAAPVSDVAVSTSAGLVSVVSGSVVDFVDFFARVVLGLASSSPVAAFLARLGLSTIGSPFRPFSSAWRRTRSACASTMLDPADTTPTPMVEHSSMTCLEVIPSSLASVETRTVLLKRLHHLQRRRQPGPRRANLQHRLRVPAYSPP